MTDFLLRLRKVFRSGIVALIQQLVIGSTWPGPFRASLKTAVLWKAVLTAALFNITVPSYSQHPDIIQKPIQFDAEREKLSLEYLRDRYGIVKDSATIDPKMIVIHWTAIPDFERSFMAFHPSTLPDSRAFIKKAGNLNVSAHFLVDRDGTIYQLLPETTFARHVIGLNHCAIGIENVADGKEYPLTEAQFIANKKLVKYLIDKYDIEFLIGHDQYTNFIGHELWKENDPDYLTVKHDVGKEFMDRLHKAIANERINKAPEMKGQ